jgi:hypothetical protein
MLAQEDALAKKRIREGRNVVEIVHVAIVERKLVRAGLLGKQRSVL